jgi:Mrp family chromosome partitioning ATPase
MATRTIPTEMETATGMEPRAETETAMEGVKSMITEMPKRENVAATAPRCQPCESREYHQTILHRLPWPDYLAPQPLRTLGLTSCDRGEGVSTMAAQLAITAALDGEARVLAVDCNLANPALARLFGVKAAPGLVDCLRNGELLAEAVQPCETPNLWIVAAGELRGSPARAYDSPAFPSLLKEWVADYDLVVCDLPAACRVSSTARLSRLLDGVLLVVEAERVRWEVARRVKELLLTADARLLGAVLNKRPGSAPEWLYRDL